MKHDVVLMGGVGDNTDMPGLEDVVPLDRERIEAEWKYSVVTYENIEEADHGIKNGEDEGGEGGR